jgi:hypothetical protein
MLTFIVEVAFLVREIPKPSIFSCPGNIFRILAYG